MSSVLLWALAFITLGIPALALTRLIVDAIERKRHTEFVNNLMDAIREGKPKPSLRKQLLSMGKFALLLPIWPIATAAVLVDAIRTPHTSPRYEHDEQTEFMAYGHLKERVSVQEAENRETILDPKGERPPEPFGHLWETWQRFLQTSELGAELWAYEVPMEHSKKSRVMITAYSRGYCWVQEGKFLHEFPVEGYAAKPFGNLPTQKLHGQTP
jgi:hypothetical protein